MAGKREQVQPTRGWLLGNAALLLLVVWTAVSVVEVSHKCRALFAELQDLQSEQWSLQEGFSRLLLEESAWATYHRVEQVAGQRLGMRVPAASETRRVSR